MTGGGVMVTCGGEILPVGGSHGAQEVMATAPTGPELPPLTPIDIRRAVLAVLIRAGGGPLTISEVVRRTREDEGVDLSQLPGVDPRQRVSDMLRHQVRAGRAEVVGRGTYRLLRAVLQ